MSETIISQSTVRDRRNVMDVPVPIGPIGIIPTIGSEEMAEMIDKWLVQRRLEEAEKHVLPVELNGYIKDSYIIKPKCIRFQNGEGKVVLDHTVRGYDVFILADVCNYSVKYKIFDQENCMSPDDHFQNIKRIVSAIAGKAKRINVIMPFLYESRQHRRTGRESMDCALALQELKNLGVDEILTFDAHDPRVQNAIPLTGFENLQPQYQFIKALVKNADNLIIDKDRMMVVSPDEGAMSRNLYYAQIFGLNLGMYYKRRDLSKVVDGKNQIVSHDFLSEQSVEGMDILIVDDMIASGQSALDIAKDLKKRGCRDVYIFATFGLFTKGTKPFDEAYEAGYIKHVYCTNLTYRTPEVLKSPWYRDVDLSKFTAYLIDTLNIDKSISDLMSPTDKINSYIRRKKLIQEDPQMTLSLN